MGQLQDSITPLILFPSVFHVYIRNLRENMEIIRLRNTRNGVPQGKSKFL